MLFGKCLWVYKAMSERKSKKAKRSLKSQYEWTNDGCRRKTKGVKDGGGAHDMIHQNSVVSRT